MRRAARFPLERSLRVEARSPAARRMIEFRLPDVGEGLEEAEVIRWLVAQGDRVERDQPIVEIQTDKALVEIPAPAAGTLSRVSAEVGAIVKVGELLFVLDPGPGSHGDLRDAMETIAHTATGAADAAREKEKARAAEASGSASDRRPASLRGTSRGAEESQSRESGASGGEATGKGAPGAGPRRLRPRAAPAVRKLATELGVELQTVTGSGPGGRVLTEDVRRAAEGGERGRAAAPHAGERRAQGPTLEVIDGAAGAKRPHAADAVPVAGPGAPGGLGQAAPGRVPIAGLRRVIAQTMTKSWSTIPHIHGHDEIDAQPLVDALRGLRRRAVAAARDTAGESLAAPEPRPGDPDRLTLAVLFVLAAARALRRFPLVNASIDAEANEVVVHQEVHVGLAVATPHGLIVPVVRHADRRSLRDLAAEIDRLAHAARERKVKAEELRGGTFTVTNFGSLGGRFANPIIRPPEVGILGFGAIRERPWVVSGRIEPRPILPISFGADHRLIDGDLSVAFQEHVRELLSDPVYLLLGE